MQMTLMERVTSVDLTPSQIRSRTREIHELAVRESRHLDRGNFTSIHVDDLRRLFDAYDRKFYESGCREALGSWPLSFRISTRMTSSGGKTVREELTLESGRTRVRYEIVVSATLLYQTFHDVDRPIVVTGLRCCDRLEALQRIFEHETVHLVEMLLWGDSSCSQPRFQSIARRFFGHLEHTHQLVTPRERAAARFGVSPGDAVSFAFEGRVLRGVVNRITKRATVLVKNPGGARYSNGARYDRYYVPLSQLRPG